MFGTPDLDGFRVFVERQAALLRALPAWTLRIVAPPEFPGIGERATKIVEQHLMTSLIPATMDEMRWSFDQLRNSSQCDVERFRRCRRAFADSRSQVIYRLPIAAAGMGGDTHCARSPCRCQIVLHECASPVARTTLGTRSVREREARLKAALPPFGAARP